MPLPVDDVHALVGAHPWLAALLLILGSAVVAVVVDRVLTLILRRITRSTKNDLDDRFVDAFHGPVVKTIVLIGLGLAARQLELTEAVEGRTLKGLWTVGVLVWAVFGFRLASLLIEAASGREDRFVAIEPRTRPLFENLGKILVFVACTYALVLVWGEGATGWIASAGILGIAISLAAQDTLANLFAGVFLIMDAPYRVGDYINLENGERGKVLHIGLRSTRLLTRDEIEVTIPNSVMGSSTIVNETTGPSRRRLKVPFSIAYGCDVAQAKEVVLAAVDGVPNVIPEPAPRVRFRTMGASSLDFELQVWFHNPEHRGRVTDAVNTAIYDGLNTAGIEIPYPKQDVYVRELPGRGGA